MLNSRLLYIWLNYCQKNLSELGLKYVANTMKGLHACNYKSVKTGLFFNWLVDKSIVKFIQLMLKSWSIFYKKVKTSICILNITMLVAAFAFTDL